MARPLRIYPPGSVLHVMARGNRKQVIFQSDDDRELFIRCLAKAVRKFRWRLYAYALMPNHYHLVFACADGALSIGMQWLNGKYAQRFNRTHQLVGHLFQGTFKDYVVEAQRYHLEVLRYVILNPVRARLVHHVDDYHWSSYRATVGAESAPEWLACDLVLRDFHEDPEIARNLFRDYVAAGGATASSPYDNSVGRMYLGSERWLVDVRESIEWRLRPSDHPLEQREVLRPSIAEIIVAVADYYGIDGRAIRNGRGGTPRMLVAWLAAEEGFVRQIAIAAALKLRSAGHVSNLIQRCEEQLSSDPTLQSAVDSCTHALRGVSKPTTEALTPSTSIS